MVCYSVMGSGGVMWRVCVIVCDRVTGSECVFGSDCVNGECLCEWECRRYW